MAQLNDYNSGKTNIYLCAVKYQNLTWNLIRIILQYLNYLSDKIQKLILRPSRNRPF